MRNRVALCLAGIGILASCTLACRAAEPPLDVFGRLPSLENVALSPDGKQLAYVHAQGDDRLLMVVSLADRKAVNTVRILSKLREVEWADDTHLLLLTSSTEQPMELAGPAREYEQLQIYDIARHKIRDALAGFNDDPTLNVLVDAPMIRREKNRTYLLVPSVYFPSNRGVPGLFKVELNSGARLVQRGDENTEGWVVDGDGEVLATEKYRNFSRRWSLLFNHGNRLVEAAAGQESIEAPSISGIAPDQQSVWVKFSDPDGDPIWKPLALKDGSWGEPVAQLKGMQGLLLDRYSDRIIGATRFTDHYEYTYFDPVLQEHWSAILKGFPAQHVEPVSRSDDLKRWVVLLQNAGIGPTYMLVDFDKGASQVVGVAYEGLSGLGPVQDITYPAADGLQIPAYLTLPRGKPAQNLPLIVMPHGGPAVRDDGEFDWWAQALVAQGYAVLQPNYRGSDLGWNFLAAGFGEWGRKMQTDLSDGVRYLAKTGQIDPKRVCIVGASYGGYAALAGATLDTGVYRCAVSVAGISDLKTFLGSVAIKYDSADSRAGRYWDRFLGAKGSTDPVLDSLSPLKHIDAINAPVLMIHGKDDTVVPYEQSQLMAAAMTKAGKPVEFVTLQQEDHWLSRSATRLQMLQSVVKFLKVNNPPD